ncbi:MAG: class I SAM-dependent methyltransferase [Pyrinomonadaceae bacterium]|nr:class I SAM-dependent methyltransferase [Pyrinomonadaceae bacterium]
MSYNVTTKIQEHYDFASPYYKDLWGPHLHHGFYETGKESKADAAEQLIKLLVQRANFPMGSRVLDVGCGIGGTSIWLAQNMDCKVTGITISPVQVQMAKDAARQLKQQPTFLLNDANDLTVTGSFDVIWAVEVISHLSKRAEFFKRASKLLVKGGIICEAAWLRDDALSPGDEKKYIHPIEEGMLVQLPSLSEYKEHLDRNNLRMRYYEDISTNVAHTWDVCIEAASDRALWRLAYQHSKELVAFLRSFKAMKNGFKSGAFRYGLMISEKR